MGETHPGSVESLLSEARARLRAQISAQAEQFEKLGQQIEDLRTRHRQLEEAIQNELDVVAKAARVTAFVASDASFERLLGSVRNLITATLPEQVFDVLTEEAEQMGTRAAVFDVRGKAAWGASMRGFGTDQRTFHALAVSLSQENPFRQAYETGGHVDTTAEQLRRVRNVFDKFKPAAEDVILLLPIRSGGSVSAISYFDTGGKNDKLPVDALKILADFAGAQLDRLMALSGGISAQETTEEVPAPSVESTLSEAEGLMAGPEAAVVQPPEAPIARAEPVPAEAEEPAIETSLPPEPAAVEAPSPPPPAPAAAAEIDVSKLSDEEQKAHKDAKRFAKLLVSEIELYNKTKVSDGRKNMDLYKRLKADIERSRQTYEKRFGKTVSKQYDYFHEELVRTLAANDASALGGGYPGPSV